MDKVSVIVTVYNKEKFITDCIQSVLNQSYANIEIIIINDGSTDNSLQKLMLFKNLSNVCLITTKNQGVSCARNTGIEHALGKWITFVDGDDQLPDDSIEKLVYYASLKNADICAGKKKSFDSHHSIISKNLLADGGVYKGLSMLDMVINDHVNTHSLLGVLFNRSFIKNIRFIPHMNAHEDSRFLFECSLEKPTFLIIEEYVYDVIVNEGSLTHTPFSDAKAEIILDNAKEEYETVVSLFPDYQQKAKNLLLKASMAILANVPSKKIKKECLAYVRKHKDDLLSPTKNDEIMIFLVKNHLYWIYELRYRLKH